MWKETCPLTALKLCILEELYSSLDSKFKIPGKGLKGPGLTDNQEQLSMKTQHFLDGRERGKEQTDPGS